MELSFCDTKKLPERELHPTIKDFLLEHLL
jgi:hypothetical protein